MTTPNGAGSPPAGGRSYEQVYELATVTPPAQANPDLWNNAELARSRFSLNILSGFLSLGAGLGQLLSDLARALFGIGGSYTGSNPELIEIQDGQLELLDRVDLLGGSGYCATVMGSDYRLGPGRLRAMPFNRLIAPPQGAELVQVNRQHPGSGSTFRDEWCIRLDRPGLWQANANFNHNGDAYSNSYAQLVVLRPDLTVYSVTSLPQADQKAGGAAPAGGAPVSLFKMFVVPEEGYYVQVRWRWWDLFGIRTARGGGIYSQFAVTQWSDEIDGDLWENPDGTIDDGSAPDP